MTTSVSVQGYVLLTDYARHCGLTYSGAFLRMQQGRLEGRKEHGRWYVPTPALNDAPSRMQTVNASAHERYRLILERRDTGEGQTFRAIGEQLGVSASRAQQLYGEARRWLEQREEKRLAPRLAAICSSLSFQLTNSAPPLGRERVRRDSDAAL